MGGITRSNTQRDVNNTSMSYSIECGTKRRNATKEKARKNEEEEEKESAEGAQDRKTQLKRLKKGY